MVLRPGVRTALFACLFASVLAAQQDRITETIDVSRPVRIGGSVPRRAQPRDDRGAVEPGFRMGTITIMLRPSAAQQADLEQLLADQQNPASPNYHNWLSPEAFADRFGASQGDIDRISNWLRSEGFSIEYTARGRDFISFSGTAAQVGATFHTEIHRYQIGAESHYANARDVSLPAALAPVVSGIRGLNDFHPRAPHKPVANFNDATGTHFLVPDDVATIYDMTPLYTYGFTGAGQSIVIVGQSDIDQDDIAAFRNSGDMPPTSIQMVPVGTYPGFDGDNETEADLDLEWAGAVARGAKLIFVFSTDADYSAFYAIDNNLAPVISESFGLCEADVISNQTGATSYETEAQKGNALGITWLASSGDSGAAGCDYQATTASLGLAVSLPASLPEVTAVGGTEFSEGANSYWSTTNGAFGGSVLSYIPEISWNDTNLAEAVGGGLSASGGGVSTIYKKPSWQTGPGVPSDGARDVPDISLNASNAHDSYLIIAGGSVGAVGGTSASAPAFAGMVAVLNQFLVQNNVQSKSGVGNLNQKLYSLAAGASTSNAFHDVTAGNNIVPCAASSPNCVNGHFGYNAGVGYDLVTGLGSVDAYKLITAYAGIPVTATTTTLTANPSTILASGYTVLTATVKAASGTATPTGPISFTLGSAPLGVATLSGSGGTATASITVYGGQLAASTNTIGASYGGSPTFTSSSATATLNLGPPTATSKVTLTVTPNPVVQHPPDSKGATFTFSIVLKESGGVSTTVTGFTFGGVSYTASIAKFFGSTTLPANGTLTANLSGANITVPSTEVIVFNGRDASGATWIQQISVPFLPPQ